MSENYDRTSTIAKLKGDVPSLGAFVVASRRDMLKSGAGLLAGGLGAQILTGAAAQGGLQADSELNRLLG